VRRLKDRWLHGPQFLLELESEWLKLPCLLPDLPDEFKILKRSTVGVTKTSFLPQVFSMNRRFARFSSLYQLKKAVAWILRLRGKLLKHKVNVGPLTVNELSCAQTAIIKAAQHEFFPNEVSFLDSTVKTKDKFNSVLAKAESHLYFRSDSSGWTSEEGTY